MTPASGEGAVVHIGRHLVSMLRSHAVRLGSQPRTVIDAALDLAAAARLTRRPQRWAVGAGELDGDVPAPVSYGRLDHRLPGPVGPLPPDEAGRRWARETAAQGRNFVS